MYIHLIHYIRILQMYIFKLQKSNLKYRVTSIIIISMKVTHQK